MMSLLDSHIFYGMTPHMCKYMYPQLYPSAQGLETMASIQLEEIGRPLTIEIGFRWDKCK